MKNMNCKALTMSLLVAIIMLLPFAASAQRSDSFFSGFEDDDYENRIAYIGLGNQPFGTEPAPVGSGLLVLTVAGAGYAALRRKRSDKSGKSHKTYMACVFALAMVLAFTGCKKKIEPIVNSGETAHITLNVGNGNRHIIEPNESGYVPVSYSDGDVIYVGNGSTYIGTLSYVEEQGNVAIFEGDVNPAPNIDDVLHFYFVGGLDPSATPEKGTTTDFTVDISNQSGKLPVLSYGSATYNGGNPINCMLKNKCALVEFKFASSTQNKIAKISNMLCEAKIDFANGCITPTEKLDAIALYNDPNDETVKKKWAILLPGEEKDAMGMVENGTETHNQQLIYYYDYYDVTMRELKNGNYKYGDSAIVVRNNQTPVTNEVFRVSMNGNAVRFSPSNLQYKPSSADWRFAPDQWYYVGGTYTKGTTTYNVGNVYKDNNNGVKCKNNDISEEYDGWIDLFGWGTWGSGNNPVEVSTTASYPWTSDFNNELGGYGDWRTLTKQEWQDFITFYSTYENKCGYATIPMGNSDNDYAYGLIVIPRGVNLDVLGFTFTTLQNSKSYSANVITSEQWNTIKGKGAIFLPLTYMRYFNNGNLITNKMDAYYWSSTPNGTDYAGYFKFGAGTSLNTADNYKYYGCSVRLVR